MQTEKIMSILNELLTRVTILSSKIDTILEEVQK